MYIYNNNQLIQLRLSYYYLIHKVNIILNINFHFTYHKYCDLISDYYKIHNIRIMNYIF